MGFLPNRTWVSAPRFGHFATRCLCKALRLGARPNHWAKQGHLFFLAPPWHTGPNWPNMANLSRNRGTKQPESVELGGWNMSPKSLRGVCIEQCWSKFAVFVQTQMRRRVILRHALGRFVTNRNAFASESVVRIRWCRTPQRDDHEVGEQTGVAQHAAGIGLTRPGIGGQSMPLAPSAATESMFGVPGWATRFVRHHKFGSMQHCWPHFTLKSEPHTTEHVRNMTAGQTAKRANNCHRKRPGRESGRRARRSAQSGSASGPQRRASWVFAARATPCSEGSGCRGSLPNNKHGGPYSDCQTQARNVYLILWGPTSAQVCAGGASSRTLVSSAFYLQTRQTDQTRVFSERPRQGV